MLPVVVIAATVGCAGMLRPPVDTVSAVPPEDIEVSLFFVGDAGQPEDHGDAVLDALAARLMACRSHAVVVFLGDNIYPQGMPEPASCDRAEMERRIDLRINTVLNTSARAVSR